jgi:hypothetical protein
VDHEYIVGTEGDHQLLVGLDHKRKGLTVAVGLGNGAVLDDKRLSILDIRGCGVYDFLAK